MRRQMAHPVGSRVRPGRDDARRAPRRDRRGRRRFAGPAVLGIAAFAIAAVIAGNPGAAPPGDAIGRVAGATSVPAPAAAASAGPAAPPCDHGEVFTAHQEPDDWARTILDTTLMLRAEYAPRDLVPVTASGIEGRGKVRELVIGDLRALAAAARADGVTISVDSAYRSYDQQVASYESYRQGYGEDAALRTVARPGHSEHQLGTTLDFEGDLAWLAANASSFGFVLSYPPGASPERTCYRDEAWHFRYVGRDTAARVRVSGLSLREWLWLHQP